METKKLMYNGIYKRYPRYNCYYYVIKEDLYKGVFALLDNAVSEFFYKGRLDIHEKCTKELRMSIPEEFL